jgi:hypothetical protein
LDASEQIMRVQRKVVNPQGKQKPFPYATNGSTCNQLNTYYVAPPEWYIRENPDGPSNADCVLQKCASSTEIQKLFAGGDGEGKCNQIYKNYIENEIKQ